MRGGISALSRIVGLAVLPLALVGAAPVAPAKDKISVDQPAPDFQLKLIDGTKVTRDELRGNVIVLNFWATWCVPCRKELPTLDSYYAALKDKGFRVFAVTTEGSLQPYQLKKLFAVMHIAPVRSVKGPYAPINGAVPTNIVIDRNGVVRYVKAGAFDLDSLNALIIPLLNERSQPQPQPAP